MRWITQLVRIRMKMHRIHRLPLTCVRFMNMQMHVFPWNSLIAWTHLERRNLSSFTIKRCQFRKKRVIAIDTPDIQFCYMHAWASWTIGFSPKCVSGNLLRVCWLFDDRAARLTWPVTFSEIWHPLILYPAFRLFGIGMRLIETCEDIGCSPRGASPENW